jgi:hypothetical protein
MFSFISPCFWRLCKTCLQLLLYRCLFCVMAMLGVAYFNYVFVLPHTCPVTSLSLNFLILILWILLNLFCFSLISDVSIYSKYHSYFGMGLVCLKILAGITMILTKDVNFVLVCFPVILFGFILLLVIQEATCSWNASVMWPSSYMLQPCETQTTRML